MTPTESQVLEAFRRPPNTLIDVGHSRLAYRRFGRGPDVLFVHGWPLHSATFRRLVPLLAGELTCHVFDLPGTGQTQWQADAPIDFASHAATTRRLLDALGLERVALLAHDSGGTVARLLAAEDPRVAALVLGNTELPGHKPWLVDFYVRALRLPGGTAMLRTLMRSGAVRRSFLGFGGCFTDPAFVDGDFREHFVDPWLASPEVAEGQIRVLRSIDWTFVDRISEIHARIGVPVRLIWGTDDPFFPIERARRMLDQFGGRADLQEIPGAKLFAHEDHPREFAAHAKAFLLDALARDRAGSQTAQERALD